jgi:hypothetical protein
MKQTKLILILIFILILPTNLLAQANEPTDIQSLAIDLWPDFDQPSVLVLITGTVPANTPLPVTISIPLPANATVNAVARINAENAMIDDLNPEIGASMLTFSTPDPRFRVEYYIPYTAANNERSFTFTWLADVAVEQFELSVQQPSGAASLNVLPSANSVITGQQDGLTYHVLPVTTVLAGQPYEATVSYTMAIPQLTTELAQPAASNTTAVSPPSSTPQSATNWPLILGIVGGVFVVAALAWQFAGTSRKPTRPQKPAPRKPVTTQPRPQPKTNPRFCYECGQALHTNDKFCRECGTAVKSP